MTAHTHRRTSTAVDAPPEIALTATVDAVRPGRDDHRQIPVAVVHALLADPFDVSVHVLDQTDTLRAWLRSVLQADRVWIDTQPDDTQPDDTQLDGVAVLRAAIGPLDDGEWRVVTDDAGVEWFGIRVRSGERDVLLGANRVEGHDGCPHLVAHLVVGRLTRLLAWSAGVESERAAAQIDPLTGLGNRAAADDLMGSLAVGEALVVLDLDDFKRTNDISGHAAGDEVLRSFASLLRSRTRLGDTCARLGGDEFVLVVRDGAKAASIVARIVTEWQRSGHGTVSAGTAVRVESESPTDVYTRADLNLYSVKRSR